MAAEPQPVSTRLIHAAFDFALRRKRLVTAGALAVALAAVLATGFEIIKKEERGVMVRFGRVVDADVGPGLHYCLPFVEQLHVRKTMRIERLRVASQEDGEAAFTLLSGDTNLLEVELAVQYRINNLRDYLFAAVTPSKTLAMLVRQHLVDIVGKNFIDLVLTQNRNVVESYIAEQTALHIAALAGDPSSRSVPASSAAGGVGIEVVSLKIVDVHPIEETLAAFRDVNDAIAERTQTISRANQRKERMLARSRGQAEAVIMDARARAGARIVQAGASAEAFTALLGEYRKRPDHVAVTRYWQRMRATLDQAKLLAVNAEDEATIDVNIVEDGAALPGGLLTARDAPAPAAGEAERYENTAADRHLSIATRHAPATERDHIRAADLRSLLFDRPSVFAHRHVVTASNARPHLQTPSALRALEDTDNGHGAGAAGAVAGGAGHAAEDARLGESERSP